MQNETNQTNNRADFFVGKKHNRYWWHRTKQGNFTPLIYDALYYEEWELLKEWFRDSEDKYESTGEAGISPMSTLLGLVSGNGINRLVGVDLI